MFCVHPILQMKQGRQAIGSAVGGIIMKQSLSCFYLPQALAVVTLVALITIEANMVITGLLKMREGLSTLSTSIVYMPRWARTPIQLTVTQSVASKNNNFLRELYEPLFGVVFYWLVHAFYRELSFYLESTIARVQKP